MPDTDFPGEVAHRAALAFEHHLPIAMRLDEEPQHAAVRRPPRPAARAVDQELGLHAHPLQPSRDGEIERRLDTCYRLVDPHQMAVGVHDDRKPARPHPDFHALAPDLDPRDEALEDRTLLLRLQFPPAPGQIHRLPDDQSPLIHILDEGLDCVEDRCLIP